MNVSRKLLKLSVVAAVVVLKFTAYEIIIVPYETPPSYHVTAFDNNTSVILSGNLSSYSSSDPPNFNISAKANIVENGFPKSTLQISWAGPLDYDVASKQVTIQGEIVINGSVESNLRPSSVTLFLGLSGSKGAGAVSSMFSGPFTKVVYPPSENMSFGGIGIDGYGFYNVTISLVNEPKWSPSNGYSQSRYNFTYNTYYSVFIGSYWGTHIFTVGASLAGVSETPYVSATVVTENT